MNFFFLHLTLKRDLLNVVWISSGKGFQIFGTYVLKDFTPYEPTFGITIIKALTLSAVVSGVIVGFIYSFKNLKVLFIDAVKYMACALQPDISFCFQCSST